MRRAMALATATAAWVLLIQAASMAMAPPTVVELSPVDVAVDVSVDVSQDSSESEPTFQPEPTPTSPLTVTTSTIVVPSDGSSTTTTTATSTTTRPPTATTAAPVPTTTAPPVPTTTAPPATTTTVATAAGSYSAGAESDFVARINGLRGSVGLAGLSGSGELNNYARWWAKQMADTGNFAHSDIGSLLNPWTVVGENIGYGPTVGSTFDNLVASTLHYKNMVDPRFTAVGVGAYIDAAGRIWTAHLFGG